MSNSLRNWLVIAFLSPVLVEVAVSWLLVMFPSGAYAEGFAYIVVLVGLIIAIPVTLIANSALVPRAANWSSVILARSLIVPGIYTVAILVYYTGFWDKVIDHCCRSRRSKSILLLVAG